MVTWLSNGRVARDMRGLIYERELKAKFGNLLLTEISHEDLPMLTNSIVDRGASATVVHTREIVMQVFCWAMERGQRLENPADHVRPNSIARFQSRDRSLMPEEIGVMYKYLEKVGTSPVNRAAAKLLLLTMVRKGELC